MAPFNINEVKKLLSDSKEIVITTHVSPDGDAIGSSLALKFYLEKLGHEVQVITPDEYPSFLFWLPGHDEVLKYDRQKERCDEKINNAELIFCLDFNTPDRMAGLESVIVSASCKKILIDHHQNPEIWTDIMFSDSHASSTAELVYKFIEYLGDEKMLDKKIGECLYAGIVTDTGSFKFSTTSAYTHYIAYKIMELHVDTSKIQNLIYDNTSEDRLRLLGYALTEKLQIFHEFHTAVIGLTNNELLRFNFKKGDTEGIVNYPLSIDSVKMSVMVSQKGDDVRLSFRSKDLVPVHEIARDHFGGGGHINAAGGISFDSVEDTIKKIANLLPSYSKYLC